MATALRTSSSSFGGATFEVDRLDVDDGILTIEGTWSGVRGMRFVRPTLVVKDRQVLATLDHKPWAPRENTTWTASFPWTGDDAELTTASLEVAPSVIVPLGSAAPGPQVRAGTAPPASPAEAIAAAQDVAETARDDHRGDELRALRRDMLALQSQADDAARAQRTAEADRDRALAMRDEAARDLEAAMRTRDRMDGSRDEALAAVTDVERERDDAIAAVERQRDKAIAAAERDRDKAVAAAQRDRDKAVAAAEKARAAADKARAEAVAARDAMVAERDEAVARGDELRAQRDEVLLAHRTLEQQLHSVRAGHEPAPDTEIAVSVASSDPEKPIGMRSIPAARIAAADLLGPRRTGRADLSTFDLWTMRVLGTAAAVCFLLLLLMLLRVFV